MERARVKKEKIKEVKQEAKEECVTQVQCQSAQHKQRLVEICMFTIQSP